MKQVLTTNRRQSGDIWSQLRLINASVPYTTVASTMFPVFQYSWLYRMSTNCDPLVRPVPHRQPPVYHSQMVSRVDRKIKYFQQLSTVIYQIIWKSKLIIVHNIHSVHVFSTLTISGTKGALTGTILIKISKLYAWRCVATSREL